MNHIPCFAESSINRLNAFLCFNYAIPAGGGIEDAAVKTAKRIHNQKFAELSGNDIFKGDVPPGSAETPTSAAKLREMSSSNIFADEKVQSRDYLGSVRKPTGGETRIALVYFLRSNPKKRMEGTEGETIDGAPRLQIAVRCAKAAFLLSSLKSYSNSVLRSAENDELEKEKMTREIENLRVALVKERLKIKQIKQRGSMELTLQVIFVTLISCFVIKLALDIFLD
ncbi:pentatricopeptide repeat-containing protein [Hibiscus syriacus]|uniref:Pentatricopeptide repeat-containing protein n=2 Tax=Hibiscus syriacus TaxID=106335 RepID=A0A6A2YS62_HIBSY|nr:pentatricopeptide repeat-containing protein [Hibiscus syriacus]